jgi:hypothetical protein
MSDDASVNSPSFCAWYAYYADNKALFQKRRFAKYAL